MEFVEVLYFSCWTGGEREREREREMREREIREREREICSFVVSLSFFFVQV